MKNQGKYLPVLISLEDKACLVVGAGTIALRKINTLLEYGGSVTVVAPECIQEIEQMSREGKINYKARKYLEAEAKSYDIVFAATGNPETDKLIFNDCTGNNILLNVADVPDLCAFIMPSIIKRGDLTISISSQGSAPFFAKMMKEDIESTLSEYLEDIVRLAGEFRRRMMESGIYYDEAKRNLLINKFMEINSEENFSKFGYEYVLSQMEKLLKS